jgi:hypothetical protein
MRHHSVLALPGRSVNADDDGLVAVRALSERGVITRRTFYCAVCVEPVPS